MNHEERHRIRAQRCSSPAPRGSIPSDEEDARRFAKDSARSRVEMATLARSKKRRLRHALAYNPNLPPQLDRRLSADNWFGVRAAVARQPRCSPGLLVKLATDMNVNVRVAVAKNAQCPPLALSRLAGDESWRVRQAVARSEAYDTLRAVGEIPSNLASLLTSVGLA